MRASIDSYRRADPLIGENPDPDRNSYRPQSHGAWYHDDEYNELLGLAATEHGARNPENEVATREVLDFRVRWSWIAGSSHRVRVSPVYSHTTSERVKSIDAGRQVPVTFNGPGPALVELYDSAGRLVHSRWHAVPMIYVDYFNRQVGPLVNSDYTAVKIDDPPQYSCLRVLIDADVDERQKKVIEMATSPNAPSIEIVSPAAGQVFTIDDTVDVEWVATDADGDALAYKVFIARNGEQNYHNHDGAFVRDTSYSIDGDLFARFRLDEVGVPLEEVRVRVIASDGTRSTTSESTVFYIRHAPQ